MTNKSLMVGRGQTKKLETGLVGGFSSKENLIVKNHKYKIDKTTQTCFISIEFISSFNQHPLFYFLTLSAGIRTKVQIFFSSFRGGG